MTFLTYQNSLECLYPLISTWYPEQDQSQVGNSYKVFHRFPSTGNLTLKYLHLVHSSLASITGTFSVTSPRDPTANSVSITHLSGN